MTKDGGEVATATGHGEGRMTDAGKMRCPGAIFYEANSKNKLGFLNHLIGVNEYEVDTMGNYVHKLWDGNKRAQTALRSFARFFYS